MNVRRNIIMRILFFSLIYFGFFFSHAKAQDNSQATEQLFCGESISIPPGCQFKETYSTVNGKSLRTGAKINKDDQFVHWTYFNHIPDPVKYDFPEQFLSGLLTHFEEKSGGYKKKRRKLISLNKELNGWLIEINDKEKKNTYFIYATGVINSEHVLIYCGLAKKPKNNKGIPGFISQIIRFK